MLTQKERLMNQEQELLEQILLLPSEQERAGVFVEISLNEPPAGCSGICESGVCRS